MSGIPHDELFFQNLTKAEKEVYSALLRTGEHRFVLSAEYPAVHDGPALVQPLVSVQLAALTAMEAIYHTQDSDLKTEVLKTLTYVSENTGWECPALVAFLKKREVVHAAEFEAFWRSKIEAAMQAEAKA